MDWLSIIMRPIRRMLRVPARNIAEKMTQNIQDPYAKSEIRGAVNDFLNDATNRTLTDTVEKPLRNQN